MQMKQELRQIYDDLSNGKLSQKEALDKIKAIKLRQHSKKAAVLLATPIWQNCATEAVTGVAMLDWAERHVVVCELPEINAGKLGSLLRQCECLSLQAEEEKNIAQRYSDYAVACFERIQNILRSKPQGKVLIQVVVGNQPEQVLFAGLAGLLKTAALENPLLISQLVFTSPQTTTEELAVQMQAEQAVGLDSLLKGTAIRYEQGVRQALGWEEIAAEMTDAGKPALAWQEQGVYLITGGLGGLGLVFAKDILEQTKEARVVLTGRSALDCEKQACIDGLCAQATRVSYRQVDLCDLDQVRQMIAEIQAENGKLTGILHAAGMIADNFILKKNSDEFRQVLEPKVTGTYNLDQAGQGVDLDFFVLFSSIAGAMGNVGQADYAAANGFMDQFAAYRNVLVATGERHGRTRSINWGLWQAGKMGIDAANQEMVQQATGIQPMQTAAGLKAFHHNLALPCDQMLVVEGDLSRMRSALLGEKTREAEATSQIAAAVEPSIATESETVVMDSDSLEEKTRQYLVRQCSELLKLPSHKIDPQAMLEKYGIDSILAMKLTNQLEKTFGPLSKTLFFEYQTISDLTGYFLRSHAEKLAAMFATTSDRQMKSVETRTQVPATMPENSRRESGRRVNRFRNRASRSEEANPAHSPSKTTESEAIAIIGLSGRYPEAINVEAYWNNLRQGKDCIVEVPKERWDWREYFSDDRSKPGQHFSKWGGFITGVDEFDPLFFNISPKEAKYIDPQERLFLQHAWMAIEDAGYTRVSLQTPCEQDQPGQVGVYVGLMYSEYQLFGAEAGVQGRRMGIAGSAASIANRVSYALNLHGPSMTLDTMCSSSLTAIHIACQDLKQGRTSLAIAGGVNVSIHPNKYLVLSAGQFISSDGHCQSFGEGGDGYIPGEGVGVVILKRLSEAERDGDHIYGVIRGSGLNHGGKTNGYTVPNPQAQASAIGRALAEAKVDARQISYIEAHGTGTKLGDPIEIAALSKVFQQHRQEAGFCRIGSAKSNIGHCESAAGIAGLTKVLMQMQHGQIVPSLHSAQLNPHIDFDKSPFVVNQELRPWEQAVIDGKKMPRMAGISSFGAGGSNAHMIVEEYEQAVQPSAGVGKVMVLLSARTAEQLKQKATELLDFVRARMSTLDLAAVAYTLQVGREPMEERLGFVVSWPDELIEKLQAYVAGKQDIEDAYQGAVKRNQEALSLFSTDADLQQTIDKWIANKKVSKLVEMWAKGLDVDWSKLYGEIKPQRMSLPTYPFARERYWIDITEATKTGTNGVATTVLHPLLHSNTSDLSVQRYSSSFTGDEFFLADHQVRAQGLRNQKVFSSVAYMEMARAAMEQACPAKPESTVLELHNTVWAPPTLIAEKKRISIALLANGKDQVDFEIYSEDAEQEIVHCQGRAIWSREAAPARLGADQLKAQMRQGHMDPSAVYTAIPQSGLVCGPALQSITAIHLGNNELLAQLRLPVMVADKSADYVLHPSLMDGAMQACVVLMGEGSGGSRQSRSSFALDSMRIVSPCTPEMMAWVRYASGSHAGDATVRIDIDLCDGQGNICVQMRGVSWQQVMEIAEPTVQPVINTVAASTTSAAPAVRKEIALVTDHPVSLSPVERKKPASISLSGRGKPVLDEPDSSPKTATRPKASIALTSPVAGTSSFLASSVAAASSSSVSSVRLFDCGNGVFSIEIGEPASSNPAVKGVMADLLKAMGRVQQETSLKVLTLRGVERCLAADGREQYNLAIEQKLYQSLVLFPYPVIAKVEGDAAGAGFLLAALCDFMVLNEDATYRYTDAQNGFCPTSAEAKLFSERFGDTQAQDFLYGTTAATGRQLRVKGWTCPIVAREQVGTHAEQLATMLAGKSQEALGLLKQHLRRNMADVVKTLTPVEAATEIQSDVVAKAIASSAPYLILETVANNVVVIRFAAASGEVDPKNLILDLGVILAEMQQAGYKAAVLASEEKGLLEGTEQAITEDVLQDFQRVVMESEIPVAAALAGDARGNAWLLGQVCDACVYSKTGAYSAGGMGDGTGVMQMAAVLFRHRFGSTVGKEILLSGAEYSGAELERRVGTVLVAESDQVLAAGIRVAESWAKMPRTTLAAWKKQTAATLEEQHRSLPAVAQREEQEQTSELLIIEPTHIALRSKVVTVRVHPEGIVVVKMEDREAKNMFSEAFMEGVAEAFAHIEQMPGYKVVVLTGYDSYFASGGTKESLLAIQAGQIKFTDTRIFQAALDCKLPVIAAMQGHGIGAGLALGMFADVVLLSEESRYVSPYMNYGFTPGAGATYILPSKIGQDLGRESLLTGQDYAGREWKERGLRLPVMPRKDVYATAMTLAKQIAESGRSRLMRLKRQLTGDVHQQLEETYRLEVAMHEKTFVGQSGTLAQIEKNFYQEPDASRGGAQKTSVEPATPQQEPVTTANPSADNDVLHEVTASLKTLLANELQMRESDIDENVQFIDLGLDSISGVTWVRKINEKYQTAIEAIKIYSYPMLSQFARYIKEEAEKNGALSNASAPSAIKMPIASAKCKASSAQPTKSIKRAAQKLTSWRSRKTSRFSSTSGNHQAEPIAVIGMAGQFPQAKNLEEFWQNIAQGRNCVTQVPSDRWDVDAYYQPGEPVEGKTNSRWIGALEEYDRFDPLFFNISPTEAESMDPQQRLFLQTCWHSIENAGYDARALSGSKCGVFVGCANGDYHQLSRQQRLTAQGFTGGAMSILAARISYFLNLQGPCISIDTACSSSLVAIAHACDSLISGSSDLALAGGVSVMAGPELHIKTSQAGMLSAEGKCCAFDQCADGIVLGEAVGVVLLKRLADAQRDRDIIYGVVQGWGVNQDGKTNGITAPNPESQARLEQEVYDKYQIDPAKIQLIEAHGTGTKLGDPIEVEGLKKAFGKYTQSKGHCALGSVKSNIGHCLTAAGIGGFIKLLLALQHKQLPPTINFERLNEHIDLKDSPFYINRQLQEWKLQSAQKRHAAISSFGFSGTNAHIVIGEYVPPAAIKPFVTIVQNTKKAVLLSSRTAAQLKEKARDLCNFIRKQPSLDLDEIAFTLQVGREPMEERVGFLVSSTNQLVEKLDAFVAGGQDLKDVYQGNGKRNQEALSLFRADPDLQQTIEKWIAQKKLPRLLDLWAKGLELDWNKLYSGVKPQRIALPVYPFAKERYWIDTEAIRRNAASDAAAVSLTAGLHPLLHCNTSDFNEQSYSATFSGKEFFLTDHQVRIDVRPAQKVLPGMIYPEMARAAIEQAWHDRPASTMLELHNMVWAQPIVISEKKQVSIALSPNDNDQIEYEIYSHDADQEIVHCQGCAVLSDQAAPNRLDLEQLQAQMGQSKLESANVYAGCAQMGLIYGPAFQGVTAIHLGSRQVLAHLRLPKAAEPTWGDYILHPSLVDSALQACVGLIDVGIESRRPRMPFSLEMLRIVSPCTPQMIAWVRYAEGSKSEDKVVKLDIDLCDESGNICVQLHGLSLRIMSKEISPSDAREQAINKFLAVPVWKTEAVTGVAMLDWAERHVVVCELPEINAGKLGSLLRQCQCLSLQAEEEKNIAQRYSDYAVACFERIQNILRSKPQGKVLIQVVVGNQPEQVLFAGLAGLLKTAALENPLLISQLVLTSPQTTTEELAVQMQAEQAVGLDSLLKGTAIRYEQGVRQALGWEEIAAEMTDAGKPALAWQEQGVYLITGGLGGLGLVFAKDILEQTKEARVVLTGRSALDCEKQACIDGLCAQATRVSYRQVDLCDLDQVRQMIAEIQAENGKLTGILHAAGMIADNFILKKNSDEFRQVLEPKVTGTYNLDQAGQGVDLDFFVLFSSIAGAMGNVGQADYAAANGFMDQFAAYRNVLVATGERHGRTRSINWGLWQAGKMGIDAANQEMVQQATGIQPMQTAAGLKAFHHNLALPCDQMLVVEGDLSRMRSALLGEKTREAEATSQIAAAVEPSIATESETVVMDSDSLEEKTRQYLVRQCSELLKLPSHKIDPQAMLEKYGIDSILAMKLTNQLEKTFGPLSKTLFFEYQTISDLAGYFLRSHAEKLAAMFATTSDRQMKSVETRTQVPATMPENSRRESGRRVNRFRNRASRSEEANPAHSPSKTTESEAIAIIGLSGRYPEAINVEAYWNNLRQGKDCIVEVPKERWDWREYFSDDRSKPGQHFSKWGGFITGVDEFDPLFFNISPKEAKYIDPQERLFLQHAWMAIEDAGYTRASLQTPCEQDQPGQVGVYVGLMYSEYQLFGAEAGVQGRRMGIAGSAASIANRVSYALNLHGPSMTLDTMCSSSLTAIHIACQDLKQGRTSLAIAGGVNVSIHPNKYLVLSAGQFISSDGHCQSFGEGGDGYIPGEGVGVVILKRLSEAERDGDHIYGVIRGSGLNHGGKTNGYTVPNPQAQASAIGRALAEAKVDARQISYIEAHGTGTKLGDPIEIAALSKVFQQHRQEAGFCRIGSAKSNIGHCESAAGIAGLTKVLMQMQHGQIVPSLHSAQLNPHIDFDKSPFVVNQELRPWEQAVIDGKKMPRMAGISSFGAGGSNAHMIVEEYEQAVQPSAGVGKVMVLLSARTAEQLKQKATELLDFVRARMSTLDLAAVAYTLQVGREPMEERWVLW